MLRNCFRSNGRWLVAFVAFATIFLPMSHDAESAEPQGSAVSRKRVAVLTVAEIPKENTSQGQFIRILQEAGFEASAIRADEVRNKRLEGIDIFIIGGGSGTAFNKSLGPDGGKIVQEFVRNGGGALASCAGGYSFVNGQNEALKYISIAKASVIDFHDGRWARGKAEVEIAPGDDHYGPLTMLYANGPLWEIDSEQGHDRTVALAHFRSDVKRGDDPGGVMPGTPAILGGTYGKGRFVLFSAHPEFHRKLGNQLLVADAAHWVTRGELGPDEAICWGEVFPSSRQRKPDPATPDAKSNDAVKP